MRRRLQPRCQASTESGEQCVRPARKLFCWQHGKTWDEARLRATAALRHAGPHPYE